MKIYSIKVLLEVKARSFESALKKLEPLTYRKKYKVIKLEYNGAEKR